MVSTGSTSGSGGSTTGSGSGESASVSATGAMFDYAPAPESRSVVDIASSY